MIRTPDQLIHDLKQRALDWESRFDDGGRDIDGSPLSLAFPELPEVATPAMIEAAEASLGFTLPPLLTRIYSEVANGGFGPDYGLIGLAGGHLDDQRHDIVALYRQTCSSPWRQHWPR